jgi:Rrf2 family protein
MTFLAALPAGKLAGAREISQAENIPIQFLWKILQILSRRRLIRSFKGLRGGYQLAYPAGQVTVAMVLEANGGAARLQNCVLGLPQCSDEHACPLHDKWKHLRAGVNEMLDHSTLADLASVARQPLNRQGE